MSLLHNLLDTSYQDTQFLSENMEQGDQLELSRAVHFILYGKDKEKVESFVEYINDNQYGDAVLTSKDPLQRICVTVQMPATQHLICSLSALMTCLAELFGVDYDGWECELVK